MQTNNPKHSFIGELIFAGYDMCKFILNMNKLSIGEYNIKMVFYYDNKNY